MEISKSNLKFRTISDAFSDVIDSFYYDAETFVKSKRFQRFVQIFETDAQKMFQDMKIHSDKGNQHPKVSDILKDAIVDYTKIRYLQKNNDEEKENSESDTYETKEYLNGYYSIKMTSYDLVKAVLNRIQSNLWILDMLDDGIVEWKEKKEEESFALNSIYRVLCSEIFLELYTNALQKACYDYIQQQAVVNELTDETWFRAVKNLSYRSIFHIMTKTFEYTLNAVEDRAALRMMCLDVKDSVPETLRQLAIQEDRIEILEEKYQQEIENLKVAIDAKEKKMQELTAECNSLKASNENRECSDKEKKQLQRELREEKEKYEKLYQKYQSALEYARQLSEIEKEESAEPENISVLTDNTELQTKRIVFVRDKRNENYVMMKRLAEYFPNAKFTNCIASDINTQTTDMIVVLTAYVCHGTYWNADSIARRNGIPILPVANSNVGMIINRINDAIKPRKESQL
ncbi:MAG: hypothetical protein V3G42_15980 [Oscillospiraceae bacterium]